MNPTEIFAGVNMKGLKRLIHMNEAQKKKTKSKEAKEAIDYIDAHKDALLEGLVMSLSSNDLEVIAQWISLAAVLDKHWFKSVVWAYVEDNDLISKVVFPAIMLEDEGLQALHKKCKGVSFFYHFYLSDNDIADIVVNSFLNDKVVYLEGTDAGILTLRQLLCGKFKKIKLLSASDNKELESCSFVYIGDDDSDELIDLGWRQIGVGGVSVELMRIGGVKGFDLESVFKTFNCGYNAVLGEVDITDSFNKYFDSKDEVFDYFHESNGIPEYIRNGLYLPELIDKRWLISDKKTNITFKDWLRSYCDKSDKVEFLKARKRYKELLAELESSYESFIERQVDEDIDGLEDFSDLME